MSVSGWYKYAEKKKRFINATHILYVKVTVSICYVFTSKVLNHFWHSYNITIGFRFAMPVVLPFLKYFSLTRNKFHVKDLMSVFLTHFFSLYLILNPYERSQLANGNRFKINSSSYFTIYYVIASNRI